MSESINAYTGGCLCGSIMYEASEQPMDAGICHCSMCQKSTGSAFMAIAGFPRKAFRFVKGEPKIYKSSDIKEKGFCSECGSLIFDRYLVDTGLSNPDVMWIQLGTLDRPEEVAVKWHVGIESQLPWVQFDDGLPRSRSDEDPNLQAAFETAGKEQT